ncbi:MAG TPA: ROK family protein, partial [Acidimicrobiales bacterium]|nr:ROK family protein [Acidimicrobiales bacterium]
MAGDQEDERGVLAVDLGGTHLRVAVAHHGGRVTDRREVPTPQEDPAPAALVALAQEVKASAVDPPVARAVVGIPGPVDYRRGRLEWAPHLPETWHTQLSEAHLGAALGLPVGVANDADLAAVG